MDELKIGGRTFGVHRYGGELIALLKRFLIGLQYDDILNPHPQRRLGRFISKPDDMFALISRTKDTQLCTALATNDAEVLRTQRHKPFFCFLPNKKKFSLPQYAEFNTA